MPPIFKLRAFYFYLILICCFLEIFGRGGRGGGRGGGGRGGGGRGGVGRGGYRSYGSRSSSSSGTSSGTGGSSSTIHGTENKVSSSANDNSNTDTIGHNFNGNSNSEKFNDQQPSSSGFDINSNYKQNNSPQIDWNYEERQREIDESLERMKNWRLGSYGTRKYGSTYENPYGSTFKNPYETLLKDLPKEEQRIFRESGLYTRKADTHNSASIPSGSLSTIKNQELKGGRNSRRNSVGSSKCGVRKLTNDPNISWVCTRIKKQKECTLKCIEPKKFSGISADKYTCRHGIWTPNHVPRCI